MEKNKTSNGGILKRWSQNGENPNEVVANCDHPEEVIANCENQQLEVANCDFKNMDIRSMIRVIRGQQVMLDFELAMLYGVKTSALNQAVKRNMERFPENFMFQLTKSDFRILKSQIVTSKPIERRGGTQKPPYAFTRNGIGMLSSE